MKLKFFDIEGKKIFSTIMNRRNIMIIGITGLIVAVGGWMPCFGKGQVSALHPLDAGNIVQETVEKLKNKIDSFTLTITLLSVRQGQTDSHRGLRSLLLYTSQTIRIAPPAMWPDGTPVSASARITKNEALAIIDLFAENSFLAKADRYYSERIAIDPAFPPPENAKPYTQRVSKQSPHYSIRLVLIIHDTHWHAYYEIVSDWDASMVKALEDIRRLLSERAREKIDLLLYSAKKIF